MHDEKTIVAYFSDGDTAYKAAKTLQNEGLGSTSVQQVFDNNTNQDPSYENPFTLDDAQPIARYGAVTDLNNASGDLNVAGTESGNYSVAANKFLLTLTTANDKADHAVNIISNYGGTF
ncbi:hypothetical protein [Pelotomaculum propionicicum]|uniref:General stress protein 17M-like domain-containing protein n=1 Tax=Pelotomaculum propionicicum TaxID=258475 RepID=A0A4Y7RLE2_9FIRM|nr:hypothetical protein [Pelotomaculum propionicicum]NLI14483.1 hypothetical protein [Peptococcaceae bacterium]TEB09560.1 hypothetical protein Pmgp_03056 [Pelotomaculum propionicicum]